MQGLLDGIAALDSTHLILMGLLVLAAIAAYVMVYHPFGFGSLEGFEGELATGTHYEDAHGSAPAGVNASPGLPQYQQNAGDSHVDPANKTGNPQDTNEDLKKQPDFDYSA